MIKINKIRLAWIWTETFPELMSATPALKSRWGQPGLVSPYAALFEEARKGTGPLALPWSETDPKHIDYFWKFYLETDAPDITAAEALRRMVPLREKNPCTVKLPGKQQRASLGAFHYPHGLGITINVWIDEPQLLEDAVDRAVELTHTSLFQLEWPPGNAPETLTLPQLASTILDRLRKATYGNNASQGVRSKRPFTVATVIQGSGVDADKPILENKEIHEALEGLCSLDSSWKGAQLHGLQDRTVATRKLKRGHLMYSLVCGRAVWFPDKFVNKSNKSSLGCYHRNLVLLSLQTEALTRLMSLTKQLLEGGGTIPPAMERIVLFSAGALGRMYGGDQGTYSSRSPVRQIDDLDWIPTIDYVRNYFPNLSPLQKKA
jgi:hypothetical protein